MRKSATIAALALALGACTQDQQALVQAGLYFGAVAAAPACKAVTKSAKASAICVNLSGATITVAEAIAAGEIAK